MDTISAKELSEQEFNGVRIAQPFHDLFGEIELKAVGLIWGENYSGKSTFALGLANVLADYGRIIYVPAEEHFGITLTKKINQLNAKNENLYFRKYKGLETLKEWLIEFEADIVFIDSVSVLHENDKEVVDFAQWCRGNNIGMWMVNHANKDGSYKGNSMLAHETDINVEVFKEDKVATTQKNRYLGELRTIPVPFTADQIKNGGKRRKKSQKPKRSATRKTKKKSSRKDSRLDEVESILNSV
jgi:predicted ATP-dependent serine protease